MDNPPPQYSNYPRPGFPGGPGYPSPYWRPPGVYFEAIGDAWKLVSEDLGTWVGASAIVIGMAVLQWLGSSLVMNGGSVLPTPGKALDLTAFAVGQSLSILFSIVTLMLQNGMMLMAVKKARGGSVSVGDMFAVFRRFGTLLGTLLIVYLAYMVGFCLCIIPGVFLVGALVFAPLLAVDQGVDPIEAVTRSYSTLKSSAWLMFCLLFVAGLVYGLGACLCGVGALLTLPIMTATIGLHYHYFFPPADATARDVYGYVPPTHNF